QPAQAGFVCVDAVSNRRVSEEIQPAQAGFVCVDAVSNRRVSNRRVSTAAFISPNQTDAIRRSIAL
ncbi:MAG: hypothetical protein WBL95_19425, partial [Microcoleus sp.]